jgi:hypothetical protein
MNEEPFPVLEERVLYPIQQRMFRSRRRALVEIPESRPGTVLVFEVGDSYRTVSRQHLTGAEDVLVDALSVSLVYMRPRTVVVEVKAPSASLAGEFVIRVSFSCRVVNPEVVAGAGLRDLTEPLVDHLEDDLMLTAKCAKYKMEQIADVRDVVTAQVNAHCTVRPPRIEGMTVKLRGVEVDPPPGVVDFAKSQQQETWRQSFDELRRMGEAKAIAFLKKALATAQDARVTAVQRGDMTAADVVQDLTSQEARQLGGALQLIKVMADSDRMDRVPLDIQRLVESAVSAVTGVPVDSAGDVAGLTGGQASTGTNSPADDAAPPADGRYLADEEHLLGD